MCIRDRLYIDNISYCPTDIPEEEYGIVFREVEHGTATADLSTAAEGTTVTLSVTPDEGYELVGWNIIHGNITISDDNTFVMPDDNVTLEPLFADMSAIYSLDFTNVLSGTIPPGWQVDQGNGEIHSYPNSYSSGSRSFSGFTGYQGKYVPLKETIRGFKELLEGKHDDIPEGYFLNAGSIDDVLAKVK